MKKNYDVKKNYKMKRSISVNMFISEFGENFSDHMKKKLLKLKTRCVLTRGDDKYKLDLKHVEHTQYSCNSQGKSSSRQKEYAFSEFIINDEVLYFSEKCMENDTVMQSPIVDRVYSSLNNEHIVYDATINAKKIDDSNIDYIVDSILTVCPQVSQAYLDIIKGMTSRSEDKFKNTYNSKSYL